MKRSRRKARADAAPRAAPRPAPGRRARRAPLFAIAALALILAGGAWLGLRARRHAPRTAGDPAHALAPPDAYDEANRLARADRLGESLPYYRRALEGLASDSWEVRYNYGVTLSSNSMQYLPRAGEPRLATRSSVARVMLAREAMHQLDQASRVAATSKERAKALVRYANLLAVWGLPWETLDLMRRAEYADTTDPVPAARAIVYLKHMQDPPRFGPNLTVREALEMDMSRPARPSPR